MRRGAAVMGAAVVVVVLALALPAGAIYDEITYLYTGSFDLRIPADPETSKGWMDDAIITVPHHLVIEDLDVTVSLMHTKVFDLQLFLKSPSGTRVLLNMYDPFVGYLEGEDYSATTFDDEAEVPIEDASPPFTGRFRPLEGFWLSAFDGQDAYGDWALQVYDAFYADTGSFATFTVAVTIPEPATATLLLVSLGIFRAARRPWRGRSAPGSS